MGEWSKQYVEVEGRRMAYVEFGGGDPIVFLHGNPTSSFLWRHIAPGLAAHGRCIVPDLIGMGDSEKLPDSGPGSYRFVEHRRYLDALLEQLGVRGNVVLVVHDWGSALGFDWARRHPGAVAGIAYMEAIVCSMSIEEWGPRAIFEAMRSPDGERMVLQNNVFVERILPRSIQRTLTDDEMAEYRRPYLTPGEDRRPTLTWPRQIPFDGEPADVVGIVDDYSAFLATSPIPKLFVNAEPGAILNGRVREVCRAWPNQIEVTVPGIHFVQEDSPAAITDALLSWLPLVRAGTAAAEG
ncbi:haloalkane dehalogenase [Pseudonocardia endophytica]|uniref:Haloalkane dehalogenase n=1 Tax=Pseudonocardia endophytica TaxID=401976 RepID=A0A4R1IBM9_PSEEN|nr:haloalkane dehalogenase [Pseudonocardia endophytica]TCK27862.1 haloalkane dehalogenase [Pseudonocardia endophytica]